MLKFMRDHLGKTVLAVIVFAIAFVFALWGIFPEARMGGSSLSMNEAASVGGEKITIKDYRDAVERSLSSYKAMGVDLPKELLENVKIGTLNNLVGQKLMLVEARRLGIEVSDKEVMDEIQRIPVFLDRDKKVFSVDLYKSVLTANHLSPSQFEESVKESLINQRMAQFLESRIRVTDMELEREYQISNETRNLQFVRYTREDAMKKMTVDSKELNAFLADKSKEGLIGTYYAQNNTKYNKPETVCARHILFRDSPKADGKAPKEFLDLKPNAGNFAKLAQKSSQDTGSKENGGDLGCFAKGVMDKTFEQAAFGLPVGSVSQPVHSQFGWHYVYVYKKNPPVNIPLEQARKEVAEELIKREKMEDIRKLNMAMAEDAAKRWPVKEAETTGSFNSLEGFIPKIGRADDILKAAFDPKAKIQSGPQIFESLGSVIVASVKEKKTADMAKFSTEKETQIKTLRERKFRAFLPAWMEDVKSRTKVSYNKHVTELI